MEKYKVIARDVFSPLVHPAAYFSAASGMEKFVGVKSLPWVVEFKNRVVRMCVDARHYEEEGGQILARLESSAFFKEVECKQRNAVAALLEFSRGLRDKNFAKTGNEELAGLYTGLYSLYFEMNLWGHVINDADVDHFLLSDKILSFLENAITNKRLSLNTSEAFSSLIAPKERTKLRQQDYGLYEILAAINADGEAEKLFSKATPEIIGGLSAFPSINNAVHKHVEKYDWMSFHHDGPTILDETYFVEILASEVRQGVDGKEKLKEMEESEKQTRQRKEEILGQLQLPEKEVYWLEVAKAFLFLKALRKESSFEASRCSDGLVSEIARRLSLSRIQVRHLTVEEACDALKGGKLDADEVNGRVKHSVWFSEDGGIKVFTGKDAEAYSARIYEETAAEGITELKGTPAYAGKARGVVKIVERAEDMKKMNDGDILVSPATNPNVVPAMKKAAAIVTDEGGVTCHAAIVSRELQIPCVIGTRIATKWLKDGDVVEVNATNGVIRKVES